MAMAPTPLFALSALLLALLFAPMGCKAEAGNNYLITGETLATDERLTYNDYNFIMQGDCNLVLYGGGWQSNTAHNGVDCELTLDDMGQLRIKSKDGSRVWSSSPQGTQAGEYAAVLLPEGKVAVFGPKLWDTKSGGSISSSSTASGTHGLRGGNDEYANNLLLSGQVLTTDESLTAENYQFVVQGDCNLVLYGGGWQSNTAGHGKYCFLRLDYNGKLSVRNDEYEDVWNSGKESVEGKYALILRDDGVAAIYGPVVWSTKPLNPNVAGPKKISMVTAKE